jgi:3-methylcrotonyl-CoA carboxylase alpha subunit
MAKKLMLGKNLIDGAEFKKDTNGYFVKFNEQETRVEVLHSLGNKIIFNVNGVKKVAHYYADQTGVHLDVEGRSFLLHGPKKSLGKVSAGEEEGQLKSPMPGKVLQVLVDKGESVSTGQPLLVMEAMKMEHTIKSPTDSVVEKVLFEAGDLVEGDVDLIVLAEVKKE